MSIVSLISRCMWYLVLLRRCCFEGSKFGAAVEDVRFHAVAAAALGAVAKPLPPRKESSYLGIRIRRNRHEEAGAEWQQRKEAGVVLWACKLVTAMGSRVRNRARVPGPLISESVMHSSEDEEGSCSERVL